MRAEATAMDCAALGRSVHARDTIVKRLEARKREMPFIFTSTPNLSFVREGEAGEDIILSIDDYELSFDEQLLEHVSIALHANEKIALIGENGTGKTTLLRDIYHQKSDAIRIAPNTNVGFLSQKQSETINPEHTIREELYELGFEKTSEMIAFLAQYHFTEDYLETKVATLSGGEKNLLQLLKIANAPKDLLLLDEPTSHLDLYTQIAFEQAIKAYKGAVLMVSHDFYTIANCVDSVFIIEDKTIRKMSSRKFRKMIYAKYFEKDYLEFDQKKKELETRVEQALAKKNYEGAYQIYGELVAHVKGK